MEPSILAVIVLCSQHRFVHVGSILIRMLWFFNTRCLGLAWNRRWVWCFKSSRGRAGSLRPGIVVWSCPSITHTLKKGVAQPATPKLVGFPQLQTRKPVCLQTCHVQSWRLDFSLPQVWRFGSLWLLFTLRFNGFLRSVGGAFCFSVMEHILWNTRLSVSLGVGWESLFDRNAGLIRGLVLPLYL